MTLHDSETKRSIYSRTIYKKEHGVELPLPPQIFEPLWPTFTSKRPTLDVMAQILNAIIDIIMMLVFISLIPFFFLSELWEKLKNKFTSLYEKF